MSVLNERQVSELIAKAKDYDYIRYSFPDFNGICRGKTIAGRFAAQTIKHGIAEYTGCITFGPRTEMPFIQRIDDAGYGNSNFMPASQLYDLPWAGGDKYKVGQIFCEPFWPDGTPVDPAPRRVARMQFEKLDAMGFRLYSAFEAEFIVVNKATLEPVFDGMDFGVDSILAQHTDWLFDVDQNLQKCGIDIGAMHTEYSPGQFECTTIPKWGLTTADDLIILKQAFKEILPKYGLKPTFMTRAFGNAGGSSGFHFNHSLWDKQGKCVFYDTSKPDNMSDIMRYWIGGIMKHIKAVLVLCSPTPNCYRRLHRPWSPDKEDWDIDNRFVSIRVKSANENSCLVENRLPSSACNVYLVAAATIAAGIDGIQNKIEPPAKGQLESNPPLPSMEECLAALEADEILVQSLGSEFVDWWLRAKRENELSKFGNLTMTEPPPEAEIEKERQEYFTLI